MSRNMCSRPPALRQGRDGVWLAGMLKFTEKSATCSEAIKEDTFLVGIIAASPPCRGRSWVPEDSHQLCHLISSCVCLTDTSSHFPPISLAGFYRPGFSVYRRSLGSAAVAVNIPYTFTQTDGDTESQTQGKVCVCTRTPPREIPRVMQKKGKRQTHNIAQQETGRP